MADGLTAWGWVEDDELARVLVLSPHPDDAVLSCGQFLARHPGATVVTVFCGIPASYPDPPRPWEVLAGFQPGDDVAALRREEDRRALAVLDAQPIHLDGFPEADFQPDRPPATAEEVAAALDPLVDDLDPTLVLCPLGLANPEHVTVHDAALLVRERHADRSWIAYQDVAYHHIPGLLAWRVSRLFHAGLWPTPVAMPVDRSDERKQRALAEYPSQVRALEADWSLARRFEAGVPEQYWRLAAPPEGWEGLSAR
jgi:LmbE family N-acetylglucosaminyl deacetylase